MLNELQQAARELEHEQDRRAIELVRRGVPLWTAMERAAQDVRHDRQRIPRKDGA